MATIARFVAEMGVDPAGVKAGLDRAAGYVRGFSKTMDQEISGSLSKSSNAVSSLTNKVLTLAAALGVAFAIRAGIEFNRTMESSALGIASLITAQGQLVDSTGRVLHGAAALTAAQAIATVQTKALRIAGLQTVATTQELTEAFQQAVGVGLRWGLKLDEIRKITIGITQAAGALGVPMNQLNEEVRSLLSANISSRNTRIATALGITNQDVERWRTSGQLATQILGRLQAFNIAGTATAKTWAGVTSNIREAFELFMGDAIKPAFDAFRISAGAALASVFDLNTAQISAKFAAIMSVAQSVFAGVGGVLAGAITKGVDLAKDFNRWIIANRSVIDETIRSFGVLVAAADSLVGEVLQLLGATAQVSAETGGLKVLFVAMALAVAAIHTAFQGLLLLLVPIGHFVLSAIIKPLQWMNQLIASFLHLINPGSVAGGLFEGIFGKGSLDKSAAFFDAASTAGNDFLDGIIGGWNDYNDQLAESGTAFGKLLGQIADIDRATVKLNKPKVVPPPTVLPPPGGTGKSAEDQIKDLNAITAKLVQLRSIAERTGDFAPLKGFGDKVADTMVQAGALLRNETDAMSDNAVQLTVVLDRLAEAYLNAGMAIPNLSVMQLRPSEITNPARTSLLRNTGARILSEQEQRSGRTAGDTTARLGTVGLNGVRGMPGFTLPVPKAAPLPPQVMTWQIRYHAAMSMVSDGLGKFGRGLLNVVGSGGMEVLRSIISQLNPFAIIVRALSDAMKPLEPMLAALGKIIADILAPVFEALAPIIQAFIPFFRALLQIIAPLVQALLPVLSAFVPILEALFPIIKFAAIVLTYFIQAAALAASIILRFAGNIIIVIGEIFKALAKAIDALPGVSAKHAIDVAQGVIDFGKGMLHAADAFKKTADDMGKAREDINGVQIDHTVDGINDLGDAASRVAASLLNVPSWFKIASARFHSATPIGTEPPGIEPPIITPRRRYPTIPTGTPPDGTDGTDPTTPTTQFTITGPVYVDARDKSSRELFDAILDEGKSRARAQGVGTWSEVM